MTQFLKGGFSNLYSLSVHKKHVHVTAQPSSKIIEIIIDQSIRVQIRSISLVCKITKVLTQANTNEYIFHDTVQDTYLFLAAIIRDVFDRSLQIR